MNGITSRWHFIVETMRAYIRLPYYLGFFIYLMLAARLAIKR